MYPITKRRKVKELPTIKRKVCVLDKYNINKKNVKMSLYKNEGKDGIVFEFGHYIKNRNYFTIKNSELFKFLNYDFVNIKDSLTIFCDKPKEGTVFAAYLDASDCYYMGFRTGRFSGEVEHFYMTPIGFELFKSMLYFTVSD